MKELILIKQVHQNSLVLVTFVVFLNKGFKLQPYACNRRPDLLMMSMNLDNITILKSKNVIYRCIINGISKSEAMNLLQNIFFLKH